MPVFRKFRMRPDFRFDHTDKYKVKFVRMISGVPSVVSIRRIKRFETSVSVKGMSFAIDFDAPTYRQKNTLYYVFDVELGQMQFIPPEPGVYPALNHLLLKRAGIRQLVMGMEKRKLADILIYIILAIAVGIMGGYLLGLAFPML